MGASRSAILQKVVRSAAAREPSAATDRELLQRFTRDNDQSAFETLVHRHTSMVLGVCSRALANVQDAEDACQAVFLVLANRAPDRRWQESIANWLYTTARRVAHNVRVAAERRARREGGAAVPEATEPVDRMSGRELLAALDRALDGLPVRYREPLVLCYLEGLTRDEAAARLGIPLATLHTRIGRARKQLHSVLTKAGCTLGVGLLALAVTSPAGASPLRLVTSILTAASGSPSAAVRELARGVAVNGLIHKALLALTAVAVVALGAGLSSFESSAAQPPARPAPAGAEKAQPQDAPAKAAPKETTVTGRVFDPDGAPLGGAKLFSVRPDGVKELGTAGADGKFAVSVPANLGVRLLARAEGVGVDFEFIPLNRLDAVVELRTVKDLVIRGRVVDTQGKSVAGATVNVSRVTSFGAGIDDFLAEFKRDGAMIDGKLVWRETGVLPAVTTDKDGRFALTGAGAERLVTLRVSGAGLADTDAWVITRKDFDPKPYNEAKPELRPGRPGSGRPPRRLDGPRVLHAPNTDIIAEPEKRVRGAVTDVDTGKPRVGVSVVLVPEGFESLPLHLSATTDAAGKYELRGVRKAKSYTVAVDGDPDTRHVAARVRLDDAAGYEPLTADIRVKRGVLITGKVIDTGTKKPVRGYTSIAVMPDNKHAKDYPEFGLSVGHFSATGADDTFRLVTVPGPVLLMGGSYERDAMTRYKHPVPDPKYPQYFDKPAGPATVFIGYGGNVRGLVQGQFCKVLEIKPDAETVTQDILLEPVGE
jgi:RNA polymerase sigma factor (sigma-70 family)